MTLNGRYSHSIAEKMRFRSVLYKNVNEDRPILSAAKGFSRRTACNHTQTGMGWLKSTNVQFSTCYLRKYAEIRSTLLHTTTSRCGLLLTPITMTFNDPDCPIQLTSRKVRFSDGTYMALGADHEYRVTEWAWTSTISDKLVHGS